MPITTITFTNCKDCRCKIIKHKDCKCKKKCKCPIVKITNTCKHERRDWVEQRI